MCPIPGDTIVAANEPIGDPLPHCLLPQIWICIKGDDQKLQKVPIKRKKAVVGRSPS